MSLLQLLEEKERMALCTASTFRTGLAAVAATFWMTMPATAAEFVGGDPSPATRAAPFFHFPASTYDPVSQVNAWGCWGCGWGGGWNRGGWRRRGPSAGEVIAGVAILGGIAAIAASANNNRRNRTRDVVVVDRDGFPVDERHYDERDLDRRNFERREAARPPRMGGADMARSGVNGLNAAVDQCLDRVQRDARVDSVDVAERTAQGWLVGGTLFNGSGFQCRIGNDGRIEGVDFGSGSLGAANGAQWDDDRYADARRSLGSSAPSRAVDPASGIVAIDPDSAIDADIAGQGLAANGTQPLVPLTATRLPAYPGGPIEGEELPPVAQRRGIP
jgi:hypothetical protein